MVWLGQPETGMVCIARAIRLSPHDPDLYRAQSETVVAYLVSGRYAEALEWAEKAKKTSPGDILAKGVVAACAALGGQRGGTAQKTTARLRQLQPRLSISDLMEF